MADYSQETIPKGVNKNMKTKKHPVKMNWKWTFIRWLYLTFAMLGLGIGSWYVYSSAYGEGKIYYLSGVLGFASFYGLSLMVAYGIRWIKVYKRKQARFKG